MFANLVAALFTNERIKTTDAKAKETRRLAERTITWARRLGDVLTKKPDKRTPEESARVVHAVRMARRMVRDRVAVLKLFDEIGPRYLGRARRLHPHRQDWPARRRRRSDVAAGADPRGRRPLQEGGGPQGRGWREEVRRQEGRRAEGRGWREEVRRGKKPAAEKKATGEKKPAKAKKKSEE